MFKIRQSKFRHIYCDQPKQEVRHLHAGCRRNLEEKEEEKGDMDSK